MIIFGIFHTPLITPANRESEWLKTSPGVQMDDTDTERCVDLQTQDYEAYDASFPLLSNDRDVYSLHF